jgi:p-hydroxybenzoate 3-monooxygenase
MKADVVIIGAGPSGLLLSQLLMQAGISTLVLERKDRAYVLSRIRAGVLEWGTVELLEAAGVGTRMMAEGMVHDGCVLAAGDDEIRIDFKALTGKGVMVYGQTEVTRDLYAAQDALGAQILHDVEDVEIHDPRGTPSVSFTHNGTRHRVETKAVAGCDGFHGVSRPTIPAHVRRDYEKVYPFGWLGVLSETPPVHHELIYAGHERGFVLASMRGPTLSRYYIQVPLSDRVEDWSDEAFWTELKRRLPADAVARLVTGPSIEKSIAPLRSFVSEPMAYGRLYLCGDAAHIVPPTGAKGLNLAASDVFYLSRGLISWFRQGDETLISRYSADALARVWQAMRFSWSTTLLLHRFPDQLPYERRMQEAELAALAKDGTAARLFAENYIGLPF